MRARVLYINDTKYSSVTRMCYHIVAGMLVWAIAFRMPDMVLCTV